MNKLLIAGAVLVGSFLTAAVAQEQEQTIDVDQVIAQCEEQFSPENYPDENERNRVIDECIENQLNSGKVQSDEG
ncbi:MAG: hypothetical protein ACK2TV_03880 [Anaerolineales bacterium]|jgi:hypothetical protein